MSKKIESDKKEKEKNNFYIYEPKSNSTTISYKSSDSNKKILKLNDFKILKNKKQKNTEDCSLALTEIKKNKKIYPKQNIEYENITFYKNNNESYNFKLFIKYEIIIYKIK